MRFAPFALGLAISAFAVAAGPGPAAAAATTLQVYTAFEDDQLAPIKKLFEAAHPEIEIDWVRDSTGVITARMLAEKDNPHADVVWGLAASSLLLFDQNGMLAPYTPASAAPLKAAFKPTKEPATWYGHDAFLAFACVNKPETEKRGAAIPTSWQDLLDPKFKGGIVMPNPASSGTGYLMVAGWLQMFGEEKGWAYMDKLHENIAQYLHSGSAPCSMAARGEQVIGIGLDMRGVSEKNKGAPLELVLPKEGLGWDMEAVAVVKGSKNEAAAKVLVDWALTKPAMEEYGKSYAVLALPGVPTTAKNYPADAEKLMIKNDFTWMAANRDRILTEWKKRYDAKSAPKT